MAFPVMTSIVGFSLSHATYNIKRIIQGDPGFLERGFICLKVCVCGGGGGGGYIYFIFIGYLKTGGGRVSSEPLNPI